MEDQWLVESTFKLLIISVSDRERSGNAIGSKVGLHTIREGSS
jgi:hypothetical protein